MRKPYFPSVKGSPPPLRIRVERKVRFEETDPLGIVWHGRYASFFEDARTAAGEKYGFGYPGFQKERGQRPDPDPAYGFSYSLKIQRNLFNRRDSSLVRGGPDEY